MKAKITVFLIATAMVLTATNAEARVVKKEQSWIEQIFSNDSDNMIQKSPFSQPEPRAQKHRYRHQQQNQNNARTNSEESRTQSLKPAEKKSKLGRQSVRKQSHLQSVRQQQLKALRNAQMPGGGVND